MKPGEPPRWGPGAKSAVGTAVGEESRVWFTMAQGCVTETYYPGPDCAQTRCMFLVVTDDAGYFSDERVDSEHVTRLQEPGAPIFETENRSHQQRYRILKTTFTDPSRDVLLQQVRVEPLSEHDNLSVWVFLGPGLDNEAYGSDALVDASSNALVATRGNAAIALKASCGFSKLGCAYQGPGDPWHQLKSGMAVERLPDNVGDGNVWLVGKLDCSRKASDPFVLALGFGASSEDAIRKASNSLSVDAASTAATYQQGWRKYLNECSGLKGDSAGDLYRTSIAVLKTHQSKNPPGGMVASLAVPWGATQQQILDFRYQLSWTRDAVESASAFVAVGDLASAKSAWDFLVRTQQKDGHWPQNMWLDGTPHWSGIQMDETAMPILLADLLRRHHTVCAADVWPNVRCAAAYLIQNGPGTEEDRWEDDGGYSPYTLAIEIAALLAAAEMAGLAGEPEAGDYLRAVADWWNDNVEHWTFLDNHYVRLSSPMVGRSGEILRNAVEKKAHIHSPAALALVRLGLRDPNDARVLSTLADIDLHLKCETATGPVWHRYPEDHYGEHDDGQPFNGDGRGRGWPLLAGERAHYEVARGNFDGAKKLACVLERQASACGLLPEQVWDSSDLPHRGLFSGRPSGSAMPLVWAHAEYIKLRRSIADRAVFDMPPHTVERYQKKGVKSAYALWRPDHKISFLPPGRVLRVEARQPATVYWTVDDWNTVQTAAMKDSHLGLQYCDLPTAQLAVGRQVGFTLCWADGRWENRAYQLPIRDIP